MDRSNPRQFYPNAFGFGQSMPRLDPIEPQTNDRNEDGIKYCGVCGDIAKSYHFGGLSCDSCKAFFRRSVQNDNYLHFQCCHQGDCLISLSNRKSCQFCRMKRCFGIGMEKSWVMTEDERKAMMKARADKKLSKQLAQTAATTTTIGAATSSSMRQSLSPGCSSSNDDRSSNVGDYEPKIEHMAEYLEPLEIKEIESIVTKYLHAYQHVPYRTELRQFDHDRPGVQVMEMFGTLIRRFAFYSRLMADFANLSHNDQGILLKGGVLEMCLLRGALVYDPLNNRWPNVNMKIYKDAPILKLENTGPLTSLYLFQKHMEFVGCVQAMGVDEPTIMLLVMIVLYTPERPGLVQTQWIEKCQSYYTALLEHYLNWRFGPKKSNAMFGKLLTKLSDLRELSDTHNHTNLRLGNDEVQSIQNQLNSLKLNPYRELKVVNDGEEEEAEALPVADCSNNSSSILRAKDISGQLSDIELSQTRVGPSLAVVDSASAMRTTENYSSQYESSLNHQQLHQQPMPHYSGPYPVNSENLQQQQQQQMMMNMGQQFMYAMQRSVNQVINAPHFGFEWVKPDYYFDPMSEDVKPVINSSYQINPPSDDSTESSANSVVSESDVMELYNALEEFTNKEEVQPLFQCGSVQQ